MEKNTCTKVLTFKLMGDGPEYEAQCKGEGCVREGEMDRLTMRGTGRERLFDPAGSLDGVEIFRFSGIRVSNIFGFVVQKIQKDTPSKDIDIEISKEVAEKILDYHKRNPDKKYKIVLTSESGLF